MRQRETERKEEENGLPVMKKQRFATFIPPSNSKKNTPNQKPNDPACLFGFSPEKYKKW